MTSIRSVSVAQAPTPSGAMLGLKSLVKPIAARPSVQTAARPKGPIRLLVVDDHPVVRRGLTSCLSKHSELQIVGEAKDGQEALRLIKSLAPDVVLMDIDMPQMNGVEVTEILRRDHPAVRVLILTMHRHSDYVMRIIQSGARGYLLKEAMPEEMLTAIQTVHQGETFFSPDVARFALNHFVRGNADGAGTGELTNREKEVLILIAEGFSNKQIASRLSVGVRTVETHRERVMRKLDIHSVAGLTKFAISKGLVSLRSELGRE